jgi:signal transduction histidine kinase
VGLAYDGFIEVESNGLYTFFLKSDDGSQLFLNNTPTQLMVTGAGKVPAPRQIVIRQPLSDESGPFWAEVEGTLTFVGRQQTGTELELTSEGTHMRITLRNGSQEPPRYLLGSLLRIRGICLDTSRNEKYRSADTLVVSSWKEVQVLEVAPEFWSESQRHKIRECERMNRQEASSIVRICGRLRSHPLGRLPDLEDDTGSVPIELLNSPPTQSDDEIECLGRWSQTGSNSLLCEAVWQELPKKPKNRDNALPWLTTAAQVQQLNREEAGRGYHAKIKGVVAWISENRDCVIIQDSTRGVFVGLRSAWVWDSPKLGEILDIEGTCVAGEFSPIVILDKAERLGMGRLPAPMQPTRDQLIRGSMDSQYVEIRGLVTGTHDNHLALLMSGGTVDVELDPDPTDSLVSFVNSVVRIRGCMFAKWKYPTLQVNTDHPLWFDNATICMDTPAPLDPFDAHKMPAKALMRFDVQGNIFQRVKIAGQILCGEAKMYYMTDDGFGLRFELVQPVTLEPGDEAEVVGLAELGGPSPVLREAIARKTGHAALPAPQPLALDGTNTTYDSTRVWVEGTLVDYKNHGAEQVLELQVGVKNFMARLVGKHPPASAWPLGSRLKVTGVFCALDGSPMAGRNVNSFELLLNSPEDVQVIAWPPWWTPRRALTIVAVLSGVLGIALIWIKLLRRTVEERSAQLQKQVEERQLVEQRRMMEQERTRVAQDLHDELGAGLTEMGLLGDLIKNPAMPVPEKQQYLGQLTDTARSLVTSLDEIVWAVNPRYDSVASVASYCTLFAQRFLDLAGVACRPHIPASFPEFPLDPKERHSLFLAFREALNNVVRHSGATEVRLIIEVSGGKLIILVADNGHGFDLANQSPGGEGIPGMRHRLEHLGGNCDIRSRPGAGTEVDLRLPLKNHTL